MLVNIALALIKGWVGVISSSTALIGDAIHSGSDVLASGAAYVGLWVAGRKHPNFPYGLYKAENVATLVTSIVIILAGYEIGRQAIFGGERLPDVTLAMPVALFCLFVSLAFGAWQLRMGRRLHSPALIADARDYLADSLSTTVVLIGLLGTYLGIALDRWAAAAVALFIFKVGVQLLISSVRDLLDASIDRETEEAIIALVEKCPRIRQVKRCLTRTAGGRFIVDLDVILQTPSHQLADQVADRLEEDIPRMFPRVVMARVRPHFGQGDQIRCLTPVTGLNGTITEHLSSAPWFLIENINGESGELTRQYVENPFCHSPKKKGFKVGQWLLSLKPDKVVVSSVTHHKGVALTLLEQAGVELITESEKKGSLTSVLPIYNGDQEGLL